MLRLLSIGGACLALALAAGCGDDEDDGGGSAAAPATQSRTEASSSSDTIVVHMKGFAFDPATVQAKVGQTVEWVNDDAAPHNATAEGGGDLKTETVDKGGKVRYEVDEPGTIKYICSVHPNMKGTLEVSE